MDHFNSLSSVQDRRVDPIAEVDIQYVVTTIMLICCVLCTDKHLSLVLHISCKAYI